MTDRSRRILRRVLLLAFLPFAVAGLLLSAKLLGLAPTAAAVVERYEEGSYDASARGADALHSWNWFESWVAPFDRGTAQAAGGLYNEAIEDLEIAFDAAPPEKKCDVAVNLSLSWERLGDAYVDQGLYAGARRLYETAQAVIDAAGEGCSPENAPPNEEEGREPGQELSDAADRLAQKRDAAGDAEQQLEGAPQSEEDSGDQLDELGERDQEAADEKAQQEGQERGEDGQGGYTDKPW